MVMNMKPSQWILLTLGVATTVGCTVPFLVNTRDNVSTTGNGGVVTDPGAVSSSLPIFLPQPGGNTDQPLILPSASLGPFLPVSSSNPAISGPLPSATATPFLADLTPNIDNQIGFNPLPIIQANGNLTTTQPIVKSIVKGRVLGFDPISSNYKPLSGAIVKIDDTLTLSTDAQGFYETTQEFDTALRISAASENYVASTVTNVPPGISRDIHLNALNERMSYRQVPFTVPGSVVNLAQNGKRPLVVFTDGQKSVSNATFVDPKTGRFNLDVRVLSNRSSTTGSLFTHVMEDIGNLSVITQYGYSPSVQVPVAPAQPVPTATPDTDDTAAIPLDNTNLLLSFDHLVSPEAFGEIKVDLSADAANIRLQGAVVHVYMNLPNGGRVLVAKYNDNTSTRVNQTIRVPRLPNTSFTVVAHSGSALTGSDVVVPNLQIGSTVVRQFLPVPVFSQLGEETSFSNINQTRYSIADTTPRISWNSQTNVNSFQLNLQGETADEFRWEAYTLANTLDYPNFGTEHPSSLKAGQSYRLQLSATDFDIGTFNILSNQNEFSTKLLNPGPSNFAQGYRLSYSTLSFVTE